LKNNVELGSSDKVNWFTNHSMTEEQKKKLIEDKLKRVLNHVRLVQRADKLLKS
jgi:hypothetical protein